MFIFDTTHLCDVNFWETMAAYEAPVWVSHNNCRKFVNHNRQFNDEQIKELISREAEIGIAFEAWMMVPHWEHGKSTPESMGDTLNQMINHIDHICQLAGNSCHVGIGTDLDGACGKKQCSSDLNTISDLKILPQMLSDKGYNSQDINHIMNKNFISFLQKTWKN